MHKGVVFLSSPHISTVQVHSPDKPTEEADATLESVRGVCEVH